MDVDFGKIALIFVPDSKGTIKSVNRIVNVKTKKVLWQIKKANILFRDNNPVKVYYDINAAPVSQILSINEKILYLEPMPTNIDEAKRTLVCSQDNILSKFSPYGFARTPITIDWSPTNSWELIFKIKTGNDVNTRQEFFSMENNGGVEFEILGKRLHWEADFYNSGNNKSQEYGNTTLNANTFYWVKFVKDQNNILVYLSTDGINYKLDISSKSIVFNKKINITNSHMFIGIDMAGQNAAIEHFLGEMDLNSSFLTYNNIRYRLGYIDNNYVTFIRDGAITVQNTANNLIISGFNSKNYAHSSFVVNWSTLNETTIALYILTGNNVTVRQELFSMEKTESFELEIQNSKIRWELAGENAMSKFTVKPNTYYFVEFKKVKTTYTITVYNVLNDVVQSQIGTMTQTVPNRTCSNEHLYLGIDRVSSSKDGIEPFQGKIFCNLSYLVYNGKKYKFRI